MNRVLEPDVHPDAESLNAFVERALPPPERAQIVAHLGGCARCREVVFLAQAAADADAVPLPSVRAESLPAKPARTWLRAGFAKWRIALIPAAAVATAAGLLIWVQMKSAPPAATVSQVAPAPSAPMASSVAPPSSRAAHAPAVSAAPPVAVQHVETKAARPEQRTSPSRTLTMNGPAPSEKGLNPAPVVAQQKAPDGFGADRDLHSMERQAALQQSAIAPTAPPIPLNAQEKSAEDASAAKQAQMNSIQAVAAQSPPAPVPPNLVAVHGNLMAPVSAGPRPLAAEAATAGPVELAPQPVNGLAALRLTSHLRLPTGLNAVSSAVMLDRILAVDPDGAVFLSRDAAKHWDRVPMQWTGKAVSVQSPPREFHPLNSAAQKDAALHTSPVAAVSIKPEPPVPGPAVLPPPVESMKEAKSATAAPGPRPSSAGADAALPMPGMLFKLINDRHQTWVSADGKVWRRQPGGE